LIVEQPLHDRLAIVEVPSSAWRVSIAGAVWSHPALHLGDRRAVAETANDQIDIVEAANAATAAPR